MLSPNARVEIKTKMHEAFDAITILEKLPLEIECIACFGETLLVGTKVGLSMLDFP